MGSTRTTFAAILDRLVEPFRCRAPSQTRMPPVRLDAKSPAALSLSEGERFLIRHEHPDTRPVWIPVVRRIADMVRMRTRADGVQIREHRSRSNTVLRRECVVVVGPRRGPLRHRADVLHRSAVKRDLK